MTTENSPVLGIGIIGLGGAAVAMVPRMAFNPRFKIIAAADLDTEILGRFAQDFPDAATYTNAEEMCKDPRIDLVYIARRPYCTPSTANSRCRTARTSHEKPMTINVKRHGACGVGGAARGTAGVNVKHSFSRACCASARWCVRASSASCG